MKIDGIRTVMSKERGDDPSLTITTRPTRRRGARTKEARNMNACVTSAIIDIPLVPCMSSQALAGSVS